VATGLLLTAPGVPALVMGQEFLEDKLWSDSPQRSDLMIWWDGVEGDDPDMVDFHRFTRDLLHSAARSRRCARSRSTSSTSTRRRGCSPSIAGSRARAATSWWC
jgi:hypothetical protein